MLKKLELPTAIVVAVAIIAYVVLAALGRDIPPALVTIMSVIGTIAAAVAPALKKADPEPSDKTIQINQNGDLQ